MQTETGPRAASTAEVLDGLNDLLQLDHDAVRAYDVAIEKLQDRDHAAQIAGFRADHERHIRDLNEMIAALGGTPVNEPHATGPFKEAMQSLGALAGDKGTLMAWRTNELQVRTKYDNYAKKAVFWPHDVKRLVDVNALDEERHYRWVADVLQTLGVGSGEGAETDLAGKVRERAGQAGELVARVQERVGGLAATARERIGGLDDATARAKELGGQARERAGALQSDVESRVRESPVKTLAMIFVAGFIIGRIVR